MIVVFVNRFNVFCLCFCRRVCKHYGRQFASNTKHRQDKRPNQAVLPCSCTMCIHVSYDRFSRHYVIRTLSLEHNHAVGSSEYSVYASHRRPQGTLLEHAQLLMANGANPMLLKHYLNANGCNASSKDVYNLKQKASFRGYLPTCI